jgi:hypothetical protein
MRRTWAAAAFPSVIGGPGSDFTARRFLIHLGLSDEISSQMWTRGSRGWNKLLTIGLSRNPEGWFGLAVDVFHLDHFDNAAIRRVNVDPVGTNWQREIQWRHPWVEDGKKQVLKGS